MKSKVIFITGPTASGKSELAMQLAKNMGGLPRGREATLRGEIINADSRQVYRGLDVGAAKITRQEMGGVPHHVLSIASPRQNFSLARWLKLTDQAIQKILRRGHIPICCGGTILYLRALREGWILPEAKPQPALRRSLERLSLSQLLSKLQTLDAERATTIDRHNPRRLIRAIEIATVLGKVPALKHQPKYNLLLLAPRCEMDNLALKIKERLQKRLAGIIKEIKRLQGQGLSLKRLISFGLEYDWLGRVVSGELNLTEATDHCAIEIINYAKWQLKTLRRLPDLHWVRSTDEAVSLARSWREKL